MTEKEKELLLRDLCARLPYGVYSFEDDEEPPISICSYEAEYTFIDSDGWSHKIGTFKPYLRPLKSMTDEELSFYNNHLITPGITILEENLSEYLEWMHSHHFDYRGLIPMGLALEAPEGMYKN